MRILKLVVDLACLTLCDASFLSRPSTVFLRVETHLFVPASDCQEDALKYGSELTVVSMGPPASRKYWEILRYGSYTNATCTRMNAAHPEPCRNTAPDASGVNKSPGPELTITEPLETADKARKIGYGYRVEGGYNPCSVLVLG